MVLISGIGSSQRRFNDRDIWLFIDVYIQPNVKTKGEIKMDLRGQDLSVLLHEQYKKGGNDVIDSLTNVLKTLQSEGSSYIILDELIEILTLVKEIRK